MTGPGHDPEHDEPGRIDRATRARVATALLAVERREDVRVLLAVESGSRAWGFPSRDSDRDVRFVYLRPLGVYLSTAPPRDVIEYPPDDDLDLSGWDARKMLGLLVGSNAAALEWLASPLVYRRDAPAAATLAAVGRAAAHPPALAYHYDRLARGFWPAAEGKPLRLKALFYALRPALALGWLRRFGTPPPMDLPALMAGLAPPASLVNAVGALRARKAAGVEADVAPRCPEVEAFLTETLATRAPRPGTWDRTGAAAAADALFLRLATDAGGSGGAS